MDHAEVPSMSREQRLSRWIDLYSDTILKTCFLYLSDRQQAEDEDGNVLTVKLELGGNG